MIALSNFAPLLVPLVPELVLMSLVRRHAALCAGLLLIVPAEAATITNRNPSHEVVVVIEGDLERDVQFGPSETLSLCKGGCVVRLSNGDEYELFGDEKVSIEDGLMFLEVPQRK
jgi:hypothetical protein